MSLNLDNELELRSQILPQLFAAAWWWRRSAGVLDRRTPGATLVHALAREHDAVRAALEVDLEIVFIELDIGNRSL